MDLHHTRASFTNPFNAESCRASHAAHLTLSATNTARNYRTLLAAATSAASTTPSSGALTHRQDGEILIRMAVVEVRGKLTGVARARAARARAKRGCQT